MSVRLIPLLLLTAAISACTAASVPAQPVTQTLAPTASPTPAAKPIVYGYEVVAVYPHDPQAFTQGLVYAEGRLFESTGLWGRSSLREVQLESGVVLRQHNLAPEFFGEGLALVGDRLIQLTWQNGVGFVYDRDTFALLAEWRYSTEGWGLTFDGQHLIMSDGTPVLRFLDPQRFEVVRTVHVRDGDRAVERLNELEFIEGEVWANVWQTDWIARIDPRDGRVVGWVDLSGLLPEADRQRPVDVLNGIAYDAQNKRVFVTGKLWPKLFEIRLKPK